MYLLDTNVVSEGRKAGSGRAAPEVVEWLGSTPSEVTFLSAMTLFELELGVLRIERRDVAQGRALRGWLDGTVTPGFAGRILAMDAAVAAACAALHVPDPVSESDAWIAATALVHKLIVVTRNVGDFASTGVRTLNPWQASSR